MVAATSHLQRGQGRAQGRRRQGRLHGTDRRRTIAKLVHNMISIATRGIIAEGFTLA